MNLLSAQEDAPILWSVDRLSWHDFKAAPPTSDRVAATTASGISYEFSASGTTDELQIDFLVHTHFYPLESWYKPSLCDAFILAHEQLHFDISELFARKLRQELSEENFTPKNVKTRIKEIYNKNNSELHQFQNRYDAETNFSRNREQQLLWNEEIKTSLGLKD